VILSSWFHCNFPFIARCDFCRSRTCLNISKLSPTLLTVPVQLCRCIKIRTSKAFVSSYYSSTTCFAAKLAAIIRCTSCRGKCCPLATLLLFAFQACKILIKYFKIIFKISCSSYFIVCPCCGSGVSVIYTNGLYSCFVHEVNILYYILLFHHCRKGKVIPVIGRGGP
jgi:hypothetical protein